MSAELESPRGLTHDERAIVAALVSACRLDSASLSQILEAMYVSGSTFTEAAVNSGVVDATQIDQAVAAASKAPANELSLVEVAMRRVMRSRQIVPAEVEGEATPSARLTLAHDPYNERSEKMRLLRTELLLRAQAQGACTTLSILSPTANEGRSLLAADLAIAIAQLGHRTLLVDANLRSPQQHVLFGCENSRGLSDAIRDGTHLYLHSVSGIPQLALLTAGAAPGNPLELLSHRNFDKMLGAWRRQYQCIVFDTAPATLYADALAIAHASRNVLLVARARQTRLDDSREMLRRLSATQCQIVGAVINHF